MGARHQSRRKEQVMALQTDAGTTVLTVLSPKTARQEYACGSLKVFLLATVLNLTPLFYFQYIPSNDGPSHVYNAAMLRAYILSPIGPARGIFVLSSSLPPNLLTHSLLAVALSIFNAAFAERLLVLIYAILLPLGFRYLLRSICPITHGLEYLSLVCVYNSHLHWGFYNFLFSLVVFVFALGFWLRHRSRPSAKNIGVQCFLVTLLYFSHPVGLFEFWIVCSALLIVDWMQGRKMLRSELALFLSSVLVAGILYVHYTFTRSTGIVEVTTWPTLRYSASLLFSLSPLATYSHFQRVVALSVLLVIGLGILCTSKGRLRAPSNGFLVTTGITAILVFIAPTSASGGTMLAPRLVYFPVFIVCVWLVSLDWSIEPGNRLAFLAVLLASAMLASNWPLYHRYDLKMKRFLTSASAWPTDRYLFFRTAGSPYTLVLDKGGTPNLSASAAGYLAATNRQVLLGDYQGLLGYFPLTYADKISRNPEFVALMNGTGCPPMEELSRFAHSTGIPIAAFVGFPHNEASTPVCGMANVSSNPDREDFALQYKLLPN